MSQRRELTTDDWNGISIAAALFALGMFFLGWVARGC